MTSPGDSVESWVARLVETDSVRLAPGEWETSKRILRILIRDGVDAWQFKISQQFTRAQIAGMTPEQVDEARQAGRLERVLAGGQ